MVQTYTHPQTYIHTYTVSCEAISVISGITPPDVKAMELKRIYDRVRIVGRTLTTEERREKRQKSLDE